jgi:hypothetical protein
VGLVLLSAIAPAFRTQRLNQSSVTRKPAVTVVDRR